MSPALRQRLLFSSLMSAAMSLVMTAWFTALNHGLHSGFAGWWLLAFAEAWPVALGSVLLLAPAVQKLTLRLLNRRDPAAGSQPALKPRG
ncbi:MULTISPECIES: DUF2798 domain-containing protein [Chromobacteriaceae]|uniref:DUF2798 domain-containing protein n=2 Tax=Chromobacteriaceae TaxID=1499392 RepID=A0ABV0CRI4_9NEIS|nr:MULTISPECIES: DUF2798 domain-containing protein [Chromobacteriaceae]AVG18551.1 hypothetical protein CFN79_03075 [Chromobacterium vaccinii]ERE18833.1 hypothetical protein O166_03045 [Pseudogulbenkiania ferrooxidans EGD-HP2]NHQ81906.1 DUF2798 domain-containing protein [Chromobacterium vaccinii]